MYWRVFKSALLGLVSKRWLPWAIVIAATALSGLYLGAYGRGNAHGRAAIQAQWDVATAAQQQALALAESEYRQRERRLQSEITGVSDELTRQLLQTETELATALDAARADAGRLRIQAAQCAARLSSAANDAGTAGSDDGPGAGGIVSEPNPAVDLLRIAADADRVAARLNACQHYVSSLIE